MKTSTVKPMRIVSCYKWNLSAYWKRSWSNDGKIERTWRVIGLKLEVAADKGVANVKLLWRTCSQNIYSVIYGQKIYKIIKYNLKNNSQWSHDHKNFTLKILKYPKYSDSQIGFRLISFSDGNAGTL